MSLACGFRAVLVVHEGTSSQAGMESRCRHIMGDMERKAKVLWDSLGLAGRLSEQSPWGGAAYVPYLPAFCSALQQGGQQWRGRWGWEMDHRK